MAGHYENRGTKQNRKNGGKKSLAKGWIAAASILILLAVAIGGFAGSAEKYKPDDVRNESIGMTELEASTETPADEENETVTATGVTAATDISACAGTESAGTTETDNDIDTSAELEEPRRLIRIEKSTDNGKWTFKTELFYNDAGQIINIEDQMYDSNGELESTVQIPVEYDEKGRMIRRGGNVTVYSEFEYNEKGQLVRSLHREGGGVEIYYEYSNSGQLMKSISRSEFTEIMGVYQYDQEGKIQCCTEIIQYLVEEHPSEEIVHHYIYDQNGSLKEILTDDVDTYYNFSHDFSPQCFLGIIYEDGTFRMQDYESYEYEPFIISEERYRVPERRNGSIEIRDVMDQIITSIYFGQGAIEMDEMGYPSQIKNDEEGIVINFYYEKISDNAAEVPIAEGTPAEEE